jgi:hypothetical protein
MAAATSTIATKASEESRLYKFIPGHAVAAAIFVRRGRRQNAASSVFISGPDNRLK